MKSLAAFLSTLSLLSMSPVVHADPWQPSPGHTQIPLWNGQIPDAQPAGAAESTRAGTHLIAGKPYMFIDDVSIPTMTVYSPARRNTGAAIVVFPGGGYLTLAIDLEGTEVCDWLTPRGISCIVLKCRVPMGGPYYDKECGCEKDPKAPMALEDAQRAMGLVRLHTAEWHIDPHKIGVMGFSAGGHMVANLSTHWDRRAYPATDAADELSCRPDFGVAVYPGHLLEKTTREFELNPTVPVTAKTPPMFLVQAVRDPVDPVNNSLVYFIALQKAKVPVELHLFAQGGHAFGLRPNGLPLSRWPNLMESWLRSIGMM